MPEQLSLIAPEPEPGASGRDHTTRAAYRARLRARLSDPAFRAIEGFPIGDDETILALSVPPFYTACPNPFLPEIITQWQAERAQVRSGHFSAPPSAEAPTTNESNAFHQDEPLSTHSIW